MPWLCVQTSSFGPFQRASAQEGPIEACAMYGLVYEACTCFAARALAAVSRFSLETMRSVTCCFSQAWISSGTGGALSHVHFARSFAAAAIASSSRSASTPRKLPSRTTVAFALSEGSEP